MDWRAIKKNDRSQDDGDGRSEELVAHYEQLRNDARGLSAGQNPAPGLALFLRQGMTSWMRAWSPCMYTTDVGTLASPATVQGLSLDIRTQMATILAGMILGQHQEATT